MHWDGLAKALSAKSAPGLPSTRGFGVWLQELDEIYQAQMVSVLLSTGVSSFLFI